MGVGLDTLTKSPDEQTHPDIPHEPKLLIRMHHVHQRYLHHAHAEPREKRHERGIT